MGNRAVIVSKDTTKENKNQKIGVYVHWYGSEEDVKRALSKAKELGVRNVEGDTTYFWARFCQIFSNIITEESGNENYETGIGVGLVSQLDTHNYDNGVYYINKDFEIENHTDGSELEDD